MLHHFLRPQPGAVYRTDPPLSGEEIRKIVGVEVARKAEELDAREKKVREHEDAVFDCVTLMEAALKDAGHEALANLIGRRVRTAFLSLEQKALQQLKL